MWWGVSAVLCTRILFLVLVQLWGEHVWCSDGGSFVAGLLFSTRVVSGVAVSVSCVSATFVCGYYC